MSSAQATVHTACYYNTLLPHSWDRGSRCIKGSLYTTLLNVHCTGISFPHLSLASRCRIPGLRCRVLCAFRLTRFSLTLRHYTRRSNPPAFFLSANCCAQVHCITSTSAGGLTAIPVLCLRFRQTSIKLSCSAVASVHGVTASLCSDHPTGQLLRSDHVNASPRQPYNPRTLSSNISSTTAATQSNSKAPAMGA